MPPTTTAPDTFLPLTAVVFDILVTLAGGDAHGYAVLTDVRERTGQFLRPGSFYRALNRLIADGLIAEAPHQTADGSPAVYRLTPLGRRVAEAEAARLEAQVASAKSARLLRSRR